MRETLNLALIFLKCDFFSFSNFNQNTVVTTKNSDFENILRLYWTKWL